MCDKFPDAGPVNRGQTNVYPCDTSFIKQAFPCTDSSSTRPCTKELLQNWKSVYGGPAATTADPKAKAAVTFTTSYDFPVVLSVTDTLNQAEHFLIKVNGNFVGETGGETGYSNLNTCGANAECAIKGPYSHGFYLVPAGQNTITIQWPYNIGLYDKWTYYYVSYRLDKPCDTDTCDPAACDKFPGAGPVNRGQTNVVPCDTSFIKTNFPCTNSSSTRPCMGSNLKPWASGTISSGATPEDAYAKKPFTTTVNYNVPVILSVTDTLNQAEHFLVRRNGVFIGETGGETGYTNLDYCGGNFECAIKDSRYTHGFFLIPAGMLPLPDATTSI